MEENKIITYWSEMYSKPNAFGSGPTKLAKLAYEIINEKPIKNILEIGCGQGRDAIFFSQQGYNVETFDISENAISFVNQTKNLLKLNNLRAIIHDVEKNFPHPEKSFDFVYSNLALQFFEIDTMGKIFKNIHKVLKDNSTVLFSTKKKGDKYYNFGNKISDDAFEHKGITRYFYDKPILEKILENHFQILSFEEDKHTNPNLTTSVWWKIQLKKN